MAYSWLTLERCLCQCFLYYIDTYTYVAIISLFLVPSKEYIVSRAHKLPCFTESAHFCVHLSSTFYYSPGQRCPDNRGSTVIHSWKFNTLCSYAVQFKYFLDKSIMTYYAAVSFSDHLLLLHQMPQNFHFHERRGLQRCFSLAIQNLHLKHLSFDLHHCQCH